MQIQNGHLTEVSKQQADEMFLKLGGKVFFTNVQPMKDRAKCPRRGWSEFVSELAAFAKKAKGMAEIWSGENAVEKLAAEIRKVPGFGGKGFRMKEKGQHKDTPTHPFPREEFTPPLIPPRGPIQVVGGSLLTLPAEFSACHFC